MATSDEITRHDDFDPDGVEFLTVLPDFSEIRVIDSDPSWPAVYEALPGPRHVGLTRQSALVPLRTGADDRGRGHLLRAGEL